MHRDRRHVFRDPGAQGDDASDVGGIRRLAYTAENHFVYPVWIKSGPREQRVDGDAAQLVGSEPREVGAHFAERRAHSIHYDQSFGLHTATSMDSPAWPEAAAASGFGALSAPESLRLSTIFCSLSCTPTP